MAIQAMSRAGNWLTSASRDYQRSTAWLQVAIAFLTLVVIGLQLVVMDYQGQVMGKQTLVVDLQTRLLERQTAMSVRPHIETEVMPESASSPYLTGPWLIRNTGEYSVRNLRTDILHFKKFDRGWMLFSGGPTPRLWTRSELAAGDAWTIEIKVLAAMHRGLNIEGLSPSGIEFTVLLLFFERAADGKRYVYVEPFYIVEDRPVARSSFVGLSGPLAKICAPEVELAFEYFKRFPFANAPEIYNIGYLSSYVSPPCLGEINWITDSSGRNTTQAPR